MSNYWHARYLQALAKADSAKSLQTRNAYLDLAVHYGAMHHLCERPVQCLGARSLCSAA
ncbi:MAG TPA: hypothetical protein VHS33_04120 [Sphingomicrobium sp.]|nr:hypothetical protein [Sphingomicrobium sp.]